MFEAVRVSQLLRILTVITIAADFFNFVHDTG